jgi:hypothetical protein
VACRSSLFPPRLVLPIAVAAALGVLTSLIVVTGIVFARPPMHSVGRFAGKDGGETRDVGVDRGFGRDRLSVHTFTEPSPGAPSLSLPSYAARQTEDGLKGKAGFWSYTWRVGWPLRCLYGRGYDGKFAYPNTPVRLESFWIVRPSDPGPPRSLEPEGNGVYIPLGIAWSGLALNSLMYGGVWYLLLATLGLMRPARRRREGHCSACGYSRRGLGSSVCPECGSPPAH